MADTRIDSAVASNLTNAITDFSVDAKSTDGPTGQKKNTWMNTQEKVTFEDALGYYKDEKTPEITAVIDTGAYWVAGKGYTTYDEPTEMLLDTIKGNGFDTFNSIIENGERTKELGGNFYAEIIRDDEENLINLKPLDPAVMRHNFDEQGMMVSFTQMSKVKGKQDRTLKLDQVFYLPRNRIADEMHGTGIAQKLKLIIDMKNEAMADNRLINHRFAYPQWIFHLDTDDPTEIAKFKATKDAATGAGENLYVPKDVVVPELVAVAPNATINLLPGIEYLDSLFYEVGGVPKIIIGGQGGFTEQAVTITYLAFQQNIEKRQLYWEEQILSQLNLVIKLIRPASVQNNLLSDKQKDGPENIDASETTAGENIQ